MVREQNQVPPLELWADLQIGGKLLADHLRNGACRGLYTNAVAERMIAHIPTLQEQIKQETQDSFHSQA